MSSEDMKPGLRPYGNVCGAEGSTRTGCRRQCATEKRQEIAEVEQPDMEVLARELNVATRTIGRDLRFQVNMQTGALGNPGSGPGNWRDYSPNTAGEGQNLRLRAR